MIKRYKQLLAEFISFQSISTNLDYLGQIEKTYQWLVNLFEKNNFKIKLLKGKNLNTVVWAKYEVNPNYKTVLIYGHYDVQPAEMDQGWVTDPFQLVEKNGKLYGRGTVDNKGQVLIHIVSVLDLIEKGELKYNVGFLIEGNEETGNDELGELLAQNKAEMHADIALISDGEIIQNVPLVEASLRGGMNIKMNIKTASFDVHSGIYGGAISNAAVIMSEFISQIYSGNTILIPGFYDNVISPSQEEMENTYRMERYTEESLNLIGVKTLLTEKGQNFFSQTGLRPTIQVTGIKSGYIAEGYANIVPFQSEARFNFRTVVGQNINKLYQDFCEFAKNSLPQDTQYTIEIEGQHDAIKLDISSEAHQKAINILTSVFGDKPLIKNVGGAIPFVLEIRKHLGIDALLIPLGNEDCNMHGPNENIDLNLVEKGINFSQCFFTEL